MAGTGVHCAYFFGKPSQRAHSLTLSFFFREEFEKAIQRKKARAAGGDEEAGVRRWWLWLDKMLLEKKQCLLDEGTVGESMLLEAFW